MKENKNIKILELFSGIGGFSKGFIDAGYNLNIHAFSEIDRNAIANYHHNFKNSEYAGPVEHIHCKRGEYDIITFGSPCQDFSLAGERRGLEGQRSGLIKEAIRIISECRPSIFIWENVKGAFSSNNSEDFWAILQEFANLGSYTIEWQLLNTLWLLPQNRERIYLVGHLTDRSKPGIFPFTENDSVFRKEKSSKKQQPQTTHSRTLKTKILRGDNTYIELPKYAKCLTAGGNSGGLHSDMNTLEVGTMRTYSDNVGFRASKTIPTLNARARKDGSGMAVLKEGRQIRRFTEIEYERLQGFPDNWTQYGNFGGVIKKISATQRYKMLGNAVTVDIVREIAKRIVLIK